VANLGLSYKNSSALSVPHHANLSLTGDWTIEAWVKLTSYAANSNMYIFWKSGDTDTYQSNYSLEVNPWWGNVFYGYTFSALNSRIGITGNSPALNEWYHVAFTRDTKKKLLQVIVHDKNRNQVSLTNVAYSPTEILVSSKDLLLGTNLSGYIDEVRISNIVRTFIQTDLKNPAKENLFEMYPNPASGIMYLRHLPGNCTVKVLSVDGKTVLTQQLNGLAETPIDISRLEKGIYFVQLMQNGKIQTEKLIVR